MRAALSDVMVDLATWLPIVGGAAATVAATWKWLQRPNRRIRMLMPLLERRYAQKIDEWDRYDKRFLEDIGRLPRRLSLSSLYVRLTFKPQQGDSDDQPDAFRELARHARTNIGVLGEPGSGKSTFLKAYAVRAMRDGGRAARQPGARGSRGSQQRRIVFLVPLREFAAGVDSAAAVSDLDGGNRLARYLVNELRRAGIHADDAEAFLARALRRDRVDVLLDGLDEVPADRLAVLRAIVGSFATDGRVELPTKQARLVVTCRTDNYRMIGAVWTDDLDMRVYELDGLRDEEMSRYVLQLRDAFDDPEQGPQRYLKAVRGSGTSALHRVPLVLAMSVGVFAGKSQYQIPDAVNDLYDKMIGHLLERHAFPHEPLSPLRFRNSHDKRRVLQRLAAMNAVGDRGGRFGTSFGAFGRAALTEVTLDLMGELDERHRLEGRTDEFVEEIVSHAGIVSPCGDGQLQFSHRSIQEYLVAAELQQKGTDGRDLLISRALDPTWSFVVQLYSAMVSNQADVNDVLTRLARVDLALAGGCLAWARPDDATAEEILRSLEGRLRGQLDRRTPTSSTEELASLQHTTRLVEAILAAVRSPRGSISDLAMGYAERALRAVVASTDAAEVVGTDTDALVQVVDMLSHVDIARFGRLIPMVTQTLPDDARLVGPLWRCLRSAEQDFDTPTPPTGLPALRLIASRLLTIVQRREALEVLQAQPHSGEPPFRALRRQVYPFTGGHPLDSNLVTLLCWGQLLDAAPSPLNRFFQARRDELRPQLFGRVEVDHGHNTRGAAFWLARLVSGAGMALALAMAGYLAVAHPGTLGRITRPATLSWLVALLAAVPAGFVTLVVRSRRWRPASRASVLLRPGAAPRQRISGNAVAECCARLLPSPLAQVAFVVSPAVYALALAPLTDASTVAFLVATGATDLLLVWLPFLAVFDRGDLGRARNPYVDMYDDEMSVNWLVPAETGATSSLVPRPRSGTGASTGLSTSPRGESR